MLLSAARWWVDHHPFYILRVWQLTHSAVFNSLTRPTNNTTPLFLLNIQSVAHGLQYVPA
jgi:hypothetical protein